MKNKPNFEKDVFQAVAVLQHHAPVVLGRELSEDEAKEILRCNGMTPEAISNMRLHTGASALLRCRQDTELEAVSKAVARWRHADMGA